MADTCSRERAAECRVYADGGSWYAFNTRTGERIDLYPIPQGGTWRDRPPAPNGGFSAAIEQFERLIGPYYPTRPGARP